MIDIPANFCGSCYVTETKQMSYGFVLITFEDRRDLFFSVICHQSEWSAAHREVANRLKIGMRAKPK